MLDAFNIKYYGQEGYEADDLIGTLVEKKSVNAPDVLSVIVTGDLDTLQLVDDNTHVYTLKKGISDIFIYDENAVVDRYGLKPDQLNDFKALKGDPSDNIPGVPGIGQKTATEVIKQFGSLEELLREIKGDQGRSGEIRGIKERVVNLIVEHEDEARLSKELVTIVRDVPIKFNLEDCGYGQFSREEVVKFFQEMQFKSLLAKIPTVKELPQVTQAELFFSQPKKISAGERFSYNLIDSQKEFDAFYKKLITQKLVCVDTETTSIDPFRAKLLGVSFSWAEGEAYYITVSSQQSTVNRAFLDKLKVFLEDETVKKIGQNIKYDIEVLAKAGVNLKGIYFDTMIASYLLNPGSRQHSLDVLAFTEFGHEKISLDSLLGRGKDKIKVEQIPVEKMSEYSCEDADFTWRLYKKLKTELKERKLLKLFDEIEMELVPVLVEMETNGIMIDPKFLIVMSRKVDQRLKKISKDIYKLAGQEFNLNSPQQLKEILFDKLKIETKDIKKTKTGLSTAAAELEKLQGKHPIIDLIFEHRELAKLKSTYLDALPLLVNPDTRRIHTSFNQTVAATGRLSSSDPNLQNIPIRTELGREIRKAFVAPKGYKILSADYSQIELRIVASIANDRAMIESFKKGEDIHTRTAADIWGVDPKEVDYDMRRAAKEINFGITYGMGVYGLSQRAGISREKAKEFIDKYFEIHQGVKKYIEDTKEFAAENGYVETLLGRPRYLPEINSGVAMIRSGAERAAINHPIQGTAADMIKIAMINLGKELEGIRGNETGFFARMLIQVHDELVFEVKENKIKSVAKLIKEEMEKAYPLKVPVVVNVSVGDSWGELAETD